MAKNKSRYWRKEEDASKDEEIMKMIKEVNEIGKKCAAESADWQRKALEHTCWVI